MNAGGKRHGQNCVCAFVTVARVNRNDYDRPQPFIGWIDIKFHEPDLAAERVFRGQWQSGPVLRGELSQRKLAPLGVLGNLFIAQ